MPFQREQTDKLPVPTAGKRFLVPGGRSLIRGPQELHLHSDESWAVGLPEDP